MWEKRLGRALRALRHRARLTQAQLGAMAGVSRTVVMRVEHGWIDNVRVGTIDSLFSALDAKGVMTPAWRGAALDRLLDEGHARLMARVIDVLTRAGWECQSEVTFSHFGERGSIDILAWHPPTRTLLVTEIKTELGSLEATLRAL